MSSEATAVVAPQALPVPIPPLREGDRLTREEFERRYDAMPHVKKAELINGVVHMSSPVRHEQHGKPHFRLITWMGHYEMVTPVVEGSDNATSRLHVIHEPQPDALMFILPEHGGQVRISADGFIEHAPDFVAEVAASSKDLDTGDKQVMYCGAGVREYLIWRTEDRAIDWFVLRDEQFVPLPPGPDGIVRSEVLPGLWLDAAALVRGDMRRVMDVLDQGLASAEHAAFLTRLHA